jgi:hypothetical protein
MPAAGRYSRVGIKGVGVAEVRTVSRGTIEHRLKEFEHKFDMPSERFVDAFRNGRLRETSEFLTWARLYSALQLFDRKP